MTHVLGPYELEIASAFGPRIISLRLGDGPELLAKLDRENAITYDGGRYEFRGGHRLWAAPEDPPVTYASDDHECEIERANGTVTVTAPPDGAGVTKSLEISADGRSLIVEHRLTSETVLRVAPWGITQLPLGGTAIVPFEADDSAPLPNRYLVCWPYTSLEDRRLTLGDEAVEVSAVDGRQLKLGVGPAPGRLGYFQDGTLFMKEIEPAGDQEVPDFGAVGQVYVGRGFCELESVGGLTDLSQDGQATLRERWTVVDCADLDEATALTVS